MKWQLLLIFYVKGALFPTLTIKHDGIAACASSSVRVSVFLPWIQEARLAFGLQEGVQTGCRESRMLLATEQIFPVHLHLYSTYGCGHFFFLFFSFFYGASCIRLIRLPDLMFTLDRNEEKKKKSWRARTQWCWAEKVEEPVSFWQPTWQNRGNGISVRPEHMRAHL